MRKLGGRSGWVVGNQIVTTAAVFGETVILARHLGSEAFGVFLLIVAFPEAVLQVLDLRVKDAMNRYLGAAFELDDRPRAVALLKLFWSLDVLVGLICLGIVAAAAVPMSELIIGSSEHAHLMIVYSLGLLLGTLDSAAGTVLRLLDRFRLAFVTGALGQLSRLALVALAVFALDGELDTIVWARVAAEVLLTAAIGGASLVLLYRLLWADRRTPASTLKEERREILGFLMSTNLTATLKMATTKLDTMLIGAFATPAAVALYRVSLQFARAPLMLADALYTAVFPTFARASAAGRRKEIRNIARSSTAIMSLVLLPVAVLGFVFGGDFIRAVGGEGFSGAGLVFALGLLSVLPYALLFWLRPLILTAGHARFLLRAQTAGTVVQLVGILALVPPFGAEGAAASLVAGNFLIVGQQALFVRRRRLLAAKPVPGA